MTGDAPAGRPGLNVFFPADNNIGTIASVVIRAELARIYSNVRAVHHEKNRGARPA